MLNFTVNYAGNMNLFQCTLPAVAHGVLTTTAIEEPPNVLPLLLLLLQLLLQLQLQSNCWVTSQPCYNLKCYIELTAACLYMN